jgi:hypothetical protein
MTDYLELGELAGIVVVLVISGFIGGVTAVLVALWAVHVI